jgi:hypothetical protein
MPWKQLLAEKRVALEPTDRTEIQSLRDVAKRGLSDALVSGLSDDGRFGHAYDAARIFATMVIRASGYRVKTQSGGHHNTFLALRAADPVFAKMAVYLDACRRKRNDLLYSQANVVTASQAEDLLARTTAFSTEVEVWLKKHYSALA